MRDFCYCVQSLGLLSAKLLRQISRIQIYTDVNLGLYFDVFSYKHDLLISKVCGLNFYLARPLHIAAHQSGRKCVETGNESAKNYSALLLSLQILTWTTNLTVSIAVFMILKYLQHVYTTISIYFGWKTISDNHGQKCWEKKQTLSILCFHVTSSFSKTKNYESFCSSSFIRYKTL